jgi:NitT/TauT family transport system substrate-binding protein
MRTKVAGVVACAMTCMLSVGIIFTQDSVASAATPANKVSITMAYSSPIPSVDEGIYSSLPQALGYWKSLNVTSLRLNGVDAVNAVALGKADIGTTATPEVIDAIAKNANLVCIYAIYTDSFVYPAVPANSSIKSAKQLDGKTVGVLSLQATSAIQLAQASIKKAGGNPSTVTFVEVGKGDTALAALKANRVQGLAEYSAAYADIAALGTPMRSLQAPAFKKLGFSDVIFANKSVLKTKKNAITTFLRGIAMASEYAKANPAKAVALHYQVFPQSKPAGTAAFAAADGLAEMKASLKDAAPVVGNQWGGEPTSAVTFTDDTYAQIGAITTNVPASKVWNGSFIAGANSFNHNAVIAAAKSKKKSS